MILSITDKPVYRAMFWNVRHSPSSAIVWEEEVGDASPLEKNLPSEHGRIR